MSIKFRHDGSIAGRNDGDRGVTGIDIFRQAGGVDADLVFLIRAKRRNHRISLPVSLNTALILEANPRRMVGIYDDKLAA
ncbi:hypothetical protein D3C86_2072840 [compost metagenome]